MQKTAAIIGGGPAGLMAAEVLAGRNIRVDVYDAMPALGRKFLMAGKSGLNLTHSEAWEDFLPRYGHRAERVRAWLNQFSPQDIRAWAAGLGVETFVGTSGRVFPKEMKASPLLRAWLKRLDAAGAHFHPHHRWTRLQNGALRFDTPEGEVAIRTDAILFALGGGSWARLGSDGGWVSAFQQMGVEVAPLRPANCGFGAAWSELIKTKFNGAALKTVALHFENFHQRGEFILTPEGVEGSLIYAASALLRDAIEASGRAQFHLDLLPDLSAEQAAQKLAKPRGARSLSSHLEKTLGLKGVKVALLYELLSKEELADATRLPARIKALPVTLLAPHPLDEAISSAGGILLEELDDSLMLKKLPGVFCAGEMLDWEAPTGGYLLTACFASGRVAGLGMANWLG